MFVSDLGGRISIGLRDYSPVQSLWYSSATGILAGAYRDGTDRAYLLDRFYHPDNLYSPLGDRAAGLRRPRRLAAEDTRSPGDAGGGGRDDHPRSPALEQAQAD